MTNSERTTRLNTVPAAAMRTERIPRHRLVDTTERVPPPPAAQHPSATTTNRIPGPVGAATDPPPDAAHPGPDPDVSRVDRSLNPEVLPDEQLDATRPIQHPGATQAPTGPGPDTVHIDQGADRSADQDTAGTGPDPDSPPVEGGSGSPTHQPPAVENGVVPAWTGPPPQQPRSRPDDEAISTGSGDPGETPVTTSLGPMTERFLGQDQPPPSPPARPRFEFRPPPSAVCTPRPTFLTAASLLWLAAAAVLLVAVVLPLVGVGDLWADISAVVNRDFPAETTVTRDRAVAAVMATLVGGGVLLALGEAAAAATLRRGRPAGRIVLALLLAVAAVHAVLTITVAPALTAGLLGVGTALGLGGAVLMFLPGTTEWLHRPRR